MKLIISKQPGIASAEGPDRKNKMADNHNMRDKPAGEPSVKLYRRAEDLTHVERESNVDREKVNAIKAAINAGTYLVDADTIAAKLMEFEFKTIKKEND